MPMIESRRFGRVSLGGCFSRLQTANCAGANEPASRMAKGTKKMAWIKYTTARIIVVDSDGDQVTVSAASTGWTLFDADSRKSETDPTFDSSSQEWGTFTKDETLNFWSDNGNVQYSHKFVGTFQDSYGNTIYVITWEDSVYGTYYGLISKGNGDGTGNTLNNAPLVNEFNAQGGVNGLTTTHAVPCFLPGTLVATPAGERMVEDLAAGDMVLTAGGQAVPVKWIGRGAVSTRFGPAERLMPVRFAPGSLGGGGGGSPLCPIAT